MSDNVELISTEPIKVIRFSSSEIQGENTALLTVTNQHSKNVAFKIKTTAPRNYIVKPSSGILNVSSSTVIKITLQASAAINPHSDRFLIQAAPADVKELDKEFWNRVSKESLFDRKFNVEIPGIIPTFDSDQAPQTPFPPSLAAATTARQSYTSMPPLTPAPPTPSLDKQPSTTNNAPPSSSTNAAAAATTATPQPTTTANATTTATITGPPPPRDMAEYCAAVEKEKNGISRELAEAKRRLAELTIRLDQTTIAAASKSASRAVQKQSVYSWYHLVLVALVAFCLAKFFTWWP